MVTMEVKPPISAASFGPLGRHNYKLRLPLQDAIRAVTSAAGMTSYINIGQAGGTIPPLPLTVVDLAIDG